MGSRVLLLDEHAIGAVRHSACAVPTRTLADVGGLASSVQETWWGVIHTKLNTVRYRSPEPWTIFDHRAVCEALREQAPDVPFMRARISTLRWPHADDGQRDALPRAIFSMRPDGVPRSRPRCDPEFR